MKKDARRACSLLLALMLAGGGAENDRNTAAPSVVRWGIMGTGRIASDFTRVLTTLAGCEVCAIASRSAASADTFAASHAPAATRHGSYEALAADEDIDIVYVATPSSRHVQDAALCLTRGKHVLVEKCMAPTEADARALLREARLADRFLLHGVWSRFFPAMRRVRELVRAGAIGRVTSVSASFCQAEGAGSCSALLETGIYAIQLALWAFEGEEPAGVDGVAATVNPNGMDEHVVALIRFPSGIATVECSLRHASKRAAYVCGTEGVIELPYPFWCPTQLLVTRMTGTASQDWDGPHQETFALPAPPEGTAERPLNYVNSEGLLYEAAEATRCVRDGVRAAPDFDDDECMRVMHLLELIRAEVQRQHVPAKA